MFGLQAAGTATVPLIGRIIQANGHLSAPESWVCWWHVFCIYLMIWSPGLRQALEVDLWRGGPITVPHWIVITSEEFVTEQKARSVNKVFFVVCFSPKSLYHSHHCKGFDLITPIIFLAGLTGLFWLIVHAGCETYRTCDQGFYL